jgi:hypothetical protein
MVGHPIDLPEKLLSRLESESTYNDIKTDDFIRKILDMAMKDVDILLPRVTMTTWMMGRGEEWLGARPGDWPEISRYILILQPGLERMKYRGKEESHETGPPFMIPILPGEYSRLGQPHDGDMIEVILRRIPK